MTWPPTKPEPPVTNTVLMKVCRGRAYARLHAQELTIPARLDGSCGAIFDTAPIPKTIALGGRMSDPRLGRSGIRNARSTVEGVRAAALVSQRSTPTIGAVFGGRVPDPRSLQSPLFRFAYGGRLHRLPAAGRRTSPASRRSARFFASPACHGLPHGALVGGGATRRSGG